MFSRMAYMMAKIHMKKIFNITSQRHANQNHNGVSHHTCYNDLSKRQKQTLERIWRKGNPSTL